jgi:predicted dehydrogenase
MTTPLRLGLVGFGKIAHDEHLPAIAETQDVELVAVASPHTRADRVANYPDVDALLASEADLDAIVMCQPPQARYVAAHKALLAGKHVFLEKPPGATVSEVDALAALASARGLSLFASWHSRYAAAVPQARAWLEGRAVRKISIAWREDVRRSHPGQAWIFEAGGFGVFDTGINALSILTEIVRDPIRLTEAELDIPANRQAPIAARLRLETGQGAPIEAVFDFLQAGPPTWDMTLETDHESLGLSQGGAMLAAAASAAPMQGEYPAMYRHFVQLVRCGESDVDLRPLELAADAFLLGRRRQTEPFEH